MEYEYWIVEIYHERGPALYLCSPTGVEYTDNPLFAWRYQSRAEAEHRLDISNVATAIRHIRATVTLLED